MFKTAISHHTYQARLTRLTVFMTIKSHFLSIHIERTEYQDHMTSIQAVYTHTVSILTTRGLNQSTLISKEAYPVSYTQCLFNHVRVNMSRVNTYQSISSNPTLYLISNSWLTIMARYISVQRVKTANKSILANRSICIITLTR